MSIETIKKLCKNKRILLVGNSIQSLSKKQGQLIDSFDVVVRFGKGHPKGYEECLGTKTNIWTTGMFRATMRDMYPEDAEVLFSPSFFTKEAEAPNYPHTVMYTQEEIESLNNKYIKTKTPGSTKNKRLSIGALTAFYLCNKIDNFATLNFINFDFFSKGVPMLSGEQKQMVVSTSWHLPLPAYKYIDTKNMLENHPAHDSLAEKALITDLLLKDNVYFIGDTNLKFEYVTPSSKVPWDKLRQPI
jgi:hypothetical protein